MPPFRFFVSLFLLSSLPIISALPATGASFDLSSSAQMPFLSDPEQIPLNETPSDDTELLNEKRLIRTSAKGPARWLPEGEIRALRIEGTKFVDVTAWEGPDAQVHTWKAPEKVAELPSSPSHQSTVNPLLEEVSPSGMRFFLEEFSTRHRTRYYKSKSGAEASRYLLKQILSLVAEGSKGFSESVPSFKLSDSPSNVTVRTFEHSWDQRSIIARFEPPVQQPESSRVEDGNQSIVIVGAHLDSVNMWLPSFGKAPGADDDGSGTTTILEAFRILVEAGFQPSRPVEFHWYSAEEAGLLGSADVARDYVNNQVRVLAMMQFDMTGYHKAGSREEIGVITDNVDPDLTDFLRKLIDEYAGLPWVDTACGYGCSDHASWREAGYASAFPFEGEFKDTSPYIHSTEDTVDNISFNHMAAFVKVALGYAVELGNPVEKEA